MLFCESESDKDGAVEIILKAVGEEGFFIRVILLFEIVMLCSCFIDFF